MALTRSICVADGNASEVRRGGAIDSRCRGRNISNANGVSIYRLLAKRANIEFAIGEHIDIPKVSQRS